MKFHRIRPLYSSLLDPYNQRMVSHTVEEGFITNEVQADFLIKNGDAILLESNLPNPVADTPPPAPPSKSKMKKVTVDDDLT
jgi:hypothetical protein